MADVDIDPVVARLIDRISSVPSVGNVYGFDVWSREDLAELLVADIDGERVLRTWWITGPTLTSRRAVSGAGEVERNWVYSIHGIEGLPEEGGAAITTLRTLGLRIADALDFDPTLGNTCQHTDPCTWPTGPEYRTVLGSAGVGYLRIVKTVRTLSHPT